MRVLVIIAITIVLSGVSLASAMENRFQQFSSDAEDAYRMYRMALFQTNKKDGVKSSQAVAKFLEEWRQLRGTYEQQPPEIFSSDPEWSNTLKQIEDIAIKSSEEISAHNLYAAHENLEAIRDELSELRRRNSVIVFSDHVNNYHAVMEGLFAKELGQGEIDDKVLDEIKGQYGVLLYLAGQIRDNAPQPYGANEKYQKLQAGLFASLEALQQAIATGNPQAIERSIKMLKQPYAKLFVNFG